MDEDRIELTGNPFVDTGLGIIGTLAELDDIDRLTVFHLKSVFGDGKQLIHWNSKLKTFSQIFGTNNPLFHPAFGFKKGVGPSDINKNIYKSTIEGLLSEIGKAEGGSRCWACGKRSDFDFAQIYKKAVEAHGETAPEEKWVGRDWFPLAGSLGSDAQALPAASTPPHICPKCLFAVHYLPLGLILLDGRLAVFQCTSREFWYDFIKDISLEIIKRIRSGNYATLGGKEGRKEIIRRLLKFFERLQKEKQHYGLPEGTTLFVWRFSNSGTSPECKIEEIPNSAIQFLWEASQNNLSSEIESLVNIEGNNPQYSLFQSILNGKDYDNLYPSGQRKGAAQKLFALYQVRVCNRSLKALNIAYRLAKEMSKHIDPKELKRMQHLEAFQELRVQNQFRALMVTMAEKGEFNIDDYVVLFPLKEGGGVTVEWGGWDLIRYYLHHTNEGFVEIEEKRQIVSPTSPYLLYYASQMFSNYIHEKGKERFKKDILAKMGRKIDISWLKTQFVKLAESKDGFTYDHWSMLCKLDDGRLYVSELLFQFRLIWEKWYRDNLSIISAPVPTCDKASNALPENVKATLDFLFADYVARRGLDRFHRDILLRLRQRELGLYWFKVKLTTKMSDALQPMTEDAWEDFLINDDGMRISNERTFQLHLYLTKLYRVKKAEENKGSAK